jgi:hypothetical protein
MKALMNLGALCVVLCLAACDDSSLTQPELDDDPAIEARRSHGFGARRISALSRNLYLGFNVDETMRARWPTRSPASSPTSWDSRRSTTSTSI